MNASSLLDTSSQFVRVEVNGPVALVTLNRPERKNSLTFESYRVLVSLFRRLKEVPEVRVVLLAGAGGNFCSGGDVHDIIAPLVKLREQGRFSELLAFTQMTGDLVKAMHACAQPIISAVDGTCVGAGAILAMSSDLRIGTLRSRVAFLFVRVGLSGADMGACALLPRIIGLGRAAELLYTGRFLEGAEAERYGFFNRIVEPDQLLTDSLTLAQSLALGPTLAHAATKSCLHLELDMDLDGAIDHEAQVQAECMRSKDFARAYRAFVAKEAPQFEGN